MLEMIYGYGMSCSDDFFMIRIAGIEREIETIRKQNKNRVFFCGDSIESGVMNKMNRVY